MENAIYAEQQQYTEKMEHVLGQILERNYILYSLQKKYQISHQNLISFLTLNLISENLGF